jgi:hypothetical protein
MITISIIDGLPFTSSIIKHKSKELELNKVLIDTGSAGTVLSSDKLIEIDIKYEPNDTIHRIRGVGGSEFVYTKTIDTISVGNLCIGNFMVEVGALDYGFNIDGIIGINFLISTGAIIDLSEKQLYASHSKK